MDALESLIDKQIRKAMEEGLFDHLPGAGKPIADLDEQLQPGWWAARIARRERSKASAELARDAINAGMSALWSCTTEAEVRDGVVAINRRVRDANVTLEPEDQLPFHDADAAVAKWQRLVEQRTRRR